MLPISRTSPVLNLVLFLLVKIDLSSSTIDVTVTPISENDGFVKNSLSDGVSFNNIPIPTPTLLSDVDKRVTNYSVQHQPSGSVLEESGSHKNVTAFDKSTQTEEIKNYSTPVNNCNNQTLFLLPDESNCGNYYEVCTHTEPTAAVMSPESRQVLMNLAHLKSCPNGTSFDSITSKCIIGHSSYCGVYHCPEPNGLFPDPDSTSRHTFIQCVDDAPKRKTCKVKNTQFDNLSKACIWDPDDLDIWLQIFKVFIKFVNYTEYRASDRNEPSLISAETEYYIKAGVVTLFVLLSYLLTVFTLYKQFHPSKGAQQQSANLSEEFYNRYYRRPARNRGFIDLQPLPSTSQAARNNLNESYFVTSRF